jgi:hypothetical protein
MMPAFPRRALQYLIARRSQAGGDEAGVALILALVFILAVASVGVALVSATGSDLLNSSNLKTQRSLEYAADGATSMATQRVRYSGATYATPGDCLPNGSSVSLDGVNVTVDCSQQQFDPVSGVTRVVNFYACTAASCTSGNAVLQAQVTFDDYSVTNSYSCSPGGPTSTCGTAMTVNTWILKTANN